MILTIRRKALKPIKKLAKLNDESVIETIRRLFRFGDILLAAREQIGPNQRIFIGDPEEGMDEMIEVTGL